MSKSQKLDIVVLGGGNSPEKFVSLRSAQAVAQGLETAGYNVSTIDPANMAADSLAAALRPADVVFPVLHGAGGEDGTIQQFLDSISKKYVGADAAVSALCFDKAQYKSAIAQYNVPTPAGELVDSTTFWQSPLVQRPFVLKPYNGGSSVDTFIIRDVAAMNPENITRALATYDTMLLEELIEGIEITVGVLGDRALPVIEIIPPADQEFDYENKYNGQTQELCPPQHVSQALQDAARGLALLIHQKLGIRDLSRTDFMIRQSDGELFVLETNTMPGMTDQSLLPKAAAVAGYTMPQLADALVQAAWQR